MPEITLFVSETCFFCHKVLESMHSYNIQVQVRDISQDPAAQEDLIRVGGKQQVPCLVVGDKALYESEAIIEWIKEHSDGSG